MTTNSIERRVARTRLGLAALVTSLLAACGGGGGGDAGQAVSAELRQRQEAAALQKAVQMAREANAVKVQGERSHGPAQAN